MTLALRTSPATSVRLRWGRERTRVSYGVADAVHTERNGDGRHVCAPHPGCITHKDVSRRKTMQCQACDIPLQIIRSQDLELHYCPRCGALYEVIGGASCEACRDAEARDRLLRRDTHLEEADDGESLAQ